MIKPLLLACLCSVPVLGSASSLFQHNERDKPLSVDAAFRLMPIERNGRHLRVSWEVAPGYYLYRERLGFEVLEPKGATLPLPKLPKGEGHHDEHFGDVHVYRNMTLTATFSLPKAGPVPTHIKLSYQGCADIGICYPPQTRTLSVPP